MDKIEPLFTATATATGGRNGHTESSDGVVAADLSVPKEMGGPGTPGTATPEHLFADRLCRVLRRRARLCRQGAQGGREQSQ
jgi:organic hydroperoxide reductase OsmC/OhrA